jgi:threonine dehydratase
VITSVIEAAKAIRPYLGRTPLVPSPLLSQHFGRNVRLKLESESPVGSFKARGALRCLMLRSAQGHRVFTTASTGNHGMAVAYAGQTLGLQTHIFVPRSGSTRKISLIGQFTRNLVLTDCDFDAAKELAQRLAADEGYYFIDDGGEASIVEGTGTIGLELLEDHVPEAVVVPVGNGALISGIGMVVKQLSPRTRVIGVQPEQAPTMYLSWKQRRPIQLETISTIADGLASRVAVPQAVTSMLQVVDDMVLVSEQQIVESQQLVLSCEARVIEPSSAAAIAALDLAELKQRDVVAIVTGRNCDLPPATAGTIRPTQL